MPTLRPLPVVLDVETTGLGHFHRPWPRPDGVVQVACAWRDPASGAVRVWREDCDPGAGHYAHGRAEGAFRVNGFGPERLARAPPAGEVAQRLRGLLEDLAREHGAVDLRAYNVAFDRPFLEAEPWSVRGPWGPCLMRAAQERLGPRTRLAEACARFGVTWPEGPAHDAGVDAHAALLLHEAMGAAAVPALR